MTKVKTIMTSKLITIPMGTPVPAAMQMMKEKRIRHLPVIDVMDDIVGVLSHRDIANCEDMKEIPVEFFMSVPVNYVDENTSLKSVVLQMLSKKISCVLVADKEENVAGIITTDDILWYLASLLEDEPREKISIVDSFNLQTVGSLANQVSEMGI